MFDANGSDFDKRGNLRSDIAFRWIGEIHGITIKEVRAYTANSEEPTKPSYSVVISDAYGFEMSLWKRSQSLEAASLVMQQLPRSTCLVVCGDVNIRKGRTYFNIKKFEYPNGEPFLFRAYGEGEVGVVDGEEDVEHSTPF